MIWNCKMIMQSIQEPFKHRGPIINSCTDNFKPRTGDQNRRRLVAPQKPPGLAVPVWPAPPVILLHPQAVNPGKKPELHLASLIRIYKNHLYERHNGLYGHACIVTKFETVDHILMEQYMAFDTERAIKLQKWLLVIWWSFLQVNSHTYWSTLLIIIEWNLVIFTVSSTLFSKLL
jgi:hypothetical protein